jgi:hypothetical protein
MNFEKIRKTTVTENFRTLQIHETIFAQQWAVEYYKLKKYLCLILNLLSLPLNCRTDKIKYLIAHIIEYIKD